MTAVFGGVLLCAFALQRLFAPAGDAVVKAVDQRPISAIGTIIAGRSAAGGLSLDDGRSAYRLTDPARARQYAGHTVRITGILHESTGLLDIRTIEPASNANSRLDHSAKAQ